MNRKSNEQKSILQVMLTDNPQAPQKNIDEHFVDDGDQIIYYIDEQQQELGMVMSDYFFGHDITIRFTLFLCYNKKIIYSIPAEPVVSFHIQITAEHQIRFADGQDNSFCSYRQSRLFWQNKDAIAYELLMGETVFVDLFFRPQQFLEMADRHPILREMAMEVSTTAIGDLDFFVALMDNKTDKFLGKIVDELFTYEMNNERFLHLSECLLLRCMGIVLPVVPRPKDAVRKKIVKPPVREEDEQVEMFTPAQKSFLDDYTIFNKKELIRMFNQDKRIYQENKNKISAKAELFKELKQHYYDVIEEEEELLADTYFDIAALLDKQVKKFEWTDAENAKLATAILALCDESFKLRIPGPIELELYMRWAESPHAPGLGLNEFSALLTMFLPELDLDISNMDVSRTGKAIFVQQMQDKLGYKPLSHFMDEDEKPEELVTLYYMLMQNMTDELTINDDGEFEKTDLIRILDHAYEINDPIPLLQIEIDKFTDDAKYVQRQSLVKISSWLLAIYEGGQELKEQEDFIKRDPLYRLLELDAGNRDQTIAVAHHAYECKRVYMRGVIALSKVAEAIKKQKIKSKLLVIASSLIHVTNKTFK